MLRPDGSAAQPVKVIQKWLKGSGGNQTETVFLASLLQRSGRGKVLSDGKRVHAHIVKRGLERNSYLGKLLVQMYGCCGSLQDARTCVATHLTLDAFSWTFLIRSYVQYGQLTEALHLFEQIHREGLLPDKYILVSILSAYSGQDGLAKGRYLHALILASTLESSVFVRTSLLSMYSNCNSLQDAKWVFDKMSERDVVSWNAMIAAYVQKEKTEDAIQLFYRMKREGVKPDKATFLSILSACAMQIALAVGKHMQVCIADSEFESDINVANALVNMYAKCGSLEDARRVFDKMPKLDVVSWNVLIAGYVQNQQGKDAFLVFKKMQNDGVAPNNVTFISVLSACSSDTDIDQGRQIHDLIVCSGFKLDAVTANTLVSMYGKCGRVKDAQMMFDKIHERDTVSWTALMTAYVQSGLDEDAFQLFEQMQWEGIMPDKVTFISILSACTSQAVLSAGRQLHARILNGGFTVDLTLGNSLVTMYGKCGRLDYAQKTFDKMTKRDVLSWNAVISAYVQNDQAKDALQVFNDMDQGGVTPDKFLCSSILSACASLAAKEKGKQIHAFVVTSGFESDIAVGNAIVNMYGKCGHLEDACMMFDKLVERDTVSWTALIAAYAQHGQGQKAVQLYNRMLQEGACPDKVTLVHVLSACSHAGLVDEGCDYFLSMIQDHGIEAIEDHYHCMVDLLGRAGQLEEAEEFLLNMPFKASSVAWTTLLGACRNQADVNRGERAAKWLFELDPENAAPYIALSNVYFAAGRDDDAERLIKRMRDKGLMQQP